MQKRVLSLSRLLFPRTACCFAAVLPRLSSTSLPPVVWLNRPLPYGRHTPTLRRVAYTPSSGIWQTVWLEHGTATLTPFWTGLPSRVSGRVGPSWCRCVRCAVCCVPCLCCMLYLCVCAVSPRASCRVCPSWRLSRSQLTYTRFGRCYVYAPTPRLQGSRPPATSTRCPSTRQFLTWAWGLTVLASQHARCGQLSAKTRALLSTLACCHAG